MTEEIKQQDEKKKKRPVTLILKGAASFISRGETFIKGVPREIEDEGLAKRLLASGLFGLAADTTKSDNYTG